MAASYTSAAARATAVTCATQLTACGGGDGLFADAVEMLCNAFPSLDVTIVRLMLTEHAQSPEALLRMLCELAGGGDDSARRALHARGSAKGHRAACGPPALVER
jgi:hypothetical protein